MLSNRIKEVRQRQGVSQTALARRCEVAEPVLSAVECGRAYCYPKLRKRLATALNVAEIELFPAARDEQAG